jgi:hypothetical protein
MSIVEGREEKSRAIAADRDSLRLLAYRAMAPALKPNERALDLVQEAILVAHQTSGFDRLPRE